MSFDTPIESINTLLQQEQKHRGKLQEAAQRLNLDELPIIGECPMQQAVGHYSTSSYTKLETLCQRIGCPLPEQPYLQVVASA